MKYTFYTSILFCLCWANTIAQNATLNGKVEETKNGKNVPLSFANVIVLGTTYGSNTDENGYYTISLPEGKYNILVSLMGYKADTLKNIVLVKGETKTLNLKLSEQSKELQQIEIGAQKITNTENAVIIETRKSDQIINAISQEQILKTQDRTASEVLRRVPGITLFNNNFLVVRGLSERYNLVLLNGILTPSSEIDKKSFSFDAIPSNALDKMVVYKTGAAELPGEFAGGIVKIYTKNSFDKDEFSIGASSSVRGNTTFKNFFYSNTSKTDWLGIDDGTRTLPSNFPNNLKDVPNAETLASLGQALPNEWQTINKNARPDIRFNVSYAKNLKTKKVKVSQLSYINYSNTLQAFVAKNYAYNVFDTAQQKSEKIYEYTDNNYQNNVRLSAMHNWNILINSKHKIEFKNLFNQTGSNQTVLRTGENFEESSDVQDYSYRYISRSFYTAQLLGTHEGKNEKFLSNWVAGFSFINSNEPDFRRIRTRRDLNAVDSVPYLVIISPVASTLDAGRFYGKLQEKVITVAPNFEQKFLTDRSNIQLSLKAGAFVEYKTRNFDARWMAYKKARTSLFNNNLLGESLVNIFQSSNINDSTGFKLDEGTNPSDRYDAQNLLVAGYASLPISINDRVNIISGLRVEHNIQQLQSATFSNKPILVYNAITSLLPSLNVSYSLNEKQKLRAAYSKTINRPEFRELAPFAFYDFQYNFNIYGNDSLKTPSIHNIDFRWEFYPSAGDMLNVAFFYKRFNNPIETIFIPGSGSGGTKDFSFSNAENAKSIGVELEIRKSLNTLIKKTFLQHVDVLFNAAYIYSKVQLGIDVVGQNLQRPLMGQSPYIVNAGLFFNQPDWKFQCNVLYNIIGKRIFAVGTAINPDIYEMPRNLLDITLSKTFGKHLELRFSIQDILNNKWALVQDSNEDAKIGAVDEPIFNFRPGTLYTFGVALKF